VVGLYETSLRLENRNFVLVSSPENPPYRNKVHLMIFALREIWKQFSQDDSIF
jgi:hypothetical protein